MQFTKIAVAAALTFALGATTAIAETRVTYKSAKAETSYYQMGVQIAEAMASRGLVKAAPRVAA